MEVQKNKTNIYSYTRRTNKSNSIWFTLLNVKEQQEILLEKEKGRCQREQITAQTGILYKFF